MIRHFQSLAEGRDNNFHIVRLVAATAVLISHSFALVTGDPNLEPWRHTIGMTPGTIAVDLFFVISGYLVALSIQRSNSATHFFWSRALRIYPGLVFMVGLITLACWFTSTLAFKEYAINWQTIKFLIKNSVLIMGVEFTLPGTFPRNPVPEVINGSLWSLPEEIKMYGVLLLVWLTSRSSAHAGAWFKYLTAGLCLAGLVGYFGWHFAGWHLPMHHAVFRLAYFFFAGTIFANFGHLIPSSARAAGLMAAVLALGVWREELFFTAYHLVLPYLLLFVCLGFKNDWTRKLNGQEDYSYGIYIWGFPIQQFCLHAVPGMGVEWLTALAFGITLIVAAFSWHFVEKPALNYRRPLIEWTHQFWARLRPHPTH
jgi:peptidoglycan/LPS O-acetylase OafA/YrhL